MPTVQSYGTHNVRVGRTMDSPAGEVADRFFGLLAGYAQLLRGGAVVFGQRLNAQGSDILRGQPPRSTCLIFITCLCDEPLASIRIGQLDTV